MSARSRGSRFCTTKEFVLPLLAKTLKTASVSRLHQLWSNTRADPSSETEANYCATNKLKERDCINSVDVSFNHLNEPTNSIILYCSGSSL